MFVQVECVEDCGNGYGWSIVDFGHTYELAVLRNGSICYSTDITSDVVRGNWDDMMHFTECIRSL